MESIRLRSVSPISYAQIIGEAKCSSSPRLSRLPSCLHSQTCLWPPKSVLVPRFIWPDPTHEELQAALAGIHCSGGYGVAFRKEEHPLRSLSEIGEHSYDGRPASSSIFARKMACRSTSQAAPSQPAIGESQIRASTMKVSGKIMLSRSVSLVRFVGGLTTVWRTSAQVKIGQYGKVVGREGIPGFNIQNEVIGHTPV